MEPSGEKGSEPAAPEATTTETQLIETEILPKEPSSQGSAAPEATTPNPPLQAGPPPAPAGTEKVTKKRRRSHDPSRDFVRLPGVTDDPLRNDLVDFGFQPEEVTALVNQKQPIWDRWRDPDCKEGKMQAEREKKEKAEADRKRRTLMEKYEPLYLGKNGDWVLFDPLIHTFPAIRDDRPDAIIVPAAFAKFERFQPGHTHIVEINFTNKSVRLRSRPSSLHGKRINYEQTGPKIISDAVEQPPPQAPAPAKRKPAAPLAKKGRPGRPRKTAPPGFSSPTSSLAKKVKEVPGKKGEEAPAKKAEDAPGKKGKDVSAVGQLRKPVQRPKAKKTVVSQEIVEDSDSELSDLGEE